MTVPEVAKATGLDDQTIRTYLSGARRPRLTSVRKLEAALGDRDYAMREALGIDAPKNQANRDREALIADVLAERAGTSYAVPQLVERIQRVEAALQRLLSMNGIDPREYLIGPSEYERQLVSMTEAAATDAAEAARATIAHIARTGNLDVAHEVQDLLAAMGGETDIEEEGVATRPTGVPEGFDEP